MQCVIEKQIIIIQKIFPIISEIIQKSQRSQFQKLFVVKDIISGVFNVLVKSNEIYSSMIAIELN